MNSTDKNTELEKKIATLKANFERDQKLGDTIPNINARFVGDAPNHFLSISVDNLQDFRMVLTQFEPEKENAVVKTASNSYEIKSPFKLEIINPARISQFSNFALRISYRCVLGFDVWVNLPASFVEDFTRKTTRKISDSEYHYFTGYTVKQIKELQIGAVCFDVDRSGVLNMYGGNQYLICGDTANEIVNHLKRL